MAVIFVQVEAYGIQGLDPAHDVFRNFIGFRNQLDVIDVRGN
jgi:hypothetical protein